MHASAGPGATDLYQAVIAEADVAVRAVEVAAEGVFQLGLEREEAGKTL